MKSVDPTLLKKAANFTTALIRHTADGLERLPEDEYRVRLSICEGTESSKPCAAFNPEKAVCRDWKCGCSLHKKAHWRSEDCPRGYWPKLR